MALMFKCRYYRASEIVFIVFCILPNTHADDLLEIFFFFYNTNNDPMFRWFSQITKPNSNSTLSTYS